MDNFNFPTGVEPSTGYDSDMPQHAVRPPRPDNRAIKGKALWREYLETIIIALLAAVILRIFVVSAYHVSSGSMENSLMPGDYIFVNKLAYEFSPPKIGDIIVFENPFDPGEDYIKRIVAVGGQTVEIYDKTVYVDGQVAKIPMNAKFIDQNILHGSLSPRDNFGPIVIPEDQYFVMGDNRDDSQDSRFWGPLDKKYIKGKAVFIYFSYAIDPKSPEWKAPYVVEFFELLWHNLTTFPSRIRPGRIGFAS